MPLAAKLAGSLLSTSEVAEALGISRQRVLQLIASRDLDAVQVGSARTATYLIAAGSVQERLDARKAAVGERLDARKAAVGERLDARKAAVGERLDAQPGRS